MKSNLSELRPAGYIYLLEKYELETIPHWHASYVTSTGAHKTKIQDEAIEEIYPIKYWPGESIGDHLEFALKYDGINLACYGSYSNYPFNKNSLTIYDQNQPENMHEEFGFFMNFLRAKYCLSIT